MRNINLLNQTKTTTNGVPRTVSKGFRCKCDEQFDWDALTLSCGFMFLLLGLACCIIQIVSITQDYVLDCHGVGLWSSAALLIPGVLAITLYMDNRVAPVTLMIASVVCDLAFGVILAMVAAALAAECAPKSGMFIGVVVACMCSIFTGAVHASLFVGEIFKLRFQLRSPKRNSVIEHRISQTMTRK